MRNKGPEKKETEETRRRLFIRAVEGDPDAFWALVEPHAGLIYSVALGIMKDHESAAGALHDVYIKAYRSLSNLKDPRRLKSWLHSLTRNMCYGVLRKSSRRMKNRPEVMRRRPRVIPISEALVKEEELRILGESLKTLPEPFRVILGMKYMSELSCREIAETLDVSVSAVKSRLYEARKLLASRMSEAQNRDKSLKRGGKL